MDSTYNYFKEGCIRWRAIRDERNIEINIMNSLTNFDNQKSLNQNNNFINKLITKKKSQLFLFFNIFGKFLKYTFLKKNFYKKIYQDEKEIISTILVLAPSRLQKVKGVSIEDKLRNISETKYQSGSEGLSIKEALKNKPTFFIPSYQKEKKYISQVDNTYGSKRDLIKIIYSINLFTIIKSIPLIIEKSKNINEIIELFILLGFINFLISKKVKNILFLTSNSRSTDCLLIAACSIGIKSKEYLHGIPSKFIYEKEKIITKFSNKHSSIRLLPVKRFCIFSKSNKGKYLNYNFDIVKLKERKNIILNQKKIIFAGGASHYKNFLESGFYRMEKFFLEIISKVVKDKFEIIYVRHPANKNKNLQFEFPKEVKISSQSIYEELINASHCISLLSSILWEANFWGIKSMICLPEPERMFSKEELEEIFIIRGLNQKEIFLSIKEFLE